MTRDMKIAVGAALIYAGAEVFLGERFPLRDPVPLTTRMAVAGGLAAVCVLLAGHLVGAEGQVAA